MHVDIRGHLLGDRKRKSGFPSLGVYPVSAQNSAAVLYAHQRPPLRTAGHADGRLFSYLIGILIGGELQHGGSSAVFPAITTAPAGPVDVDHVAGAVSRHRVARSYVKAAPLRLIHRKLPVALTIHDVDDSFFYCITIRLTDVVRVVLLRLIPPPAPAELVQRYLNIVA